MKARFQKSPYERNSVVGIERSNYLFIYIMLKSNQSEPANFTSTIWGIHLHMRYFRNSRRNAATTFCLFEPITVTISALGSRSPRCLECLSILDDNTINDRTMSIHKEDRGGLTADITSSTHVSWGDGTMEISVGPNCGVRLISVWT